MLNKTKTKTKVTEIVQQLCRLLPKQNKQFSELSRLIYLGLSAGNPVSLDSIANKIKWTEQTVKQYIKQLTHLQLNKQNLIVGYRGVTLTPTDICVHLSSNTFYTWCAFDALFMMDLVKDNMEINCQCKHCDERLNISIEGCIHSKNTDVVMSFVIPSRQNYEQDLQQVFCRYVNFFCNQNCGELWIDNAKRLQFFTLEDAFFIAIQRNKYFLNS